VQQKVCRQWLALVAAGFSGSGVSETQFQGTKTRSPCFLLAGGFAPARISQAICKGPATYITPGSLADRVLIVHYRQEARTADSGRFHYRSLAELESTLDALGIDLPLDEDLSPLAQPVPVGRWQVPNALGIQPMEGCDGTAEGAPGELTFRRYERFARGGAGLIWFEATAVSAEARSNPHQLWLTPANLAEHARLVQRVRGAHWEVFGPGQGPLLIIQLTHSGRRAKKDGKPAPVIAWHNPALDASQELSPDYPPISDDELEALEDRFAAVARLAQEAGFDGVDIKACHGYLCSELLGAHTRPGRYGGSFENRTRFLLNTIDKVRMAAPGLLLAVRLNAFDTLDYPYGWGKNQQVPDEIDLSEPIRLARLLYGRGVRLLNVSAGVPSHRPQVNRPSDKVALATPSDHPLYRIEALLHCARTIQQAVPEMAVVGTGYSWLRQYFPPAAAAHLRAGWMKIAGLGRQAFAYPDFARDLLEKGALDPRRLCTTCGKCAELLGVAAPCGCVTRDAGVYVPIYRAHCQRG